MLLAHLLHGMSSLAATLGWNHETVRPLVSKGFPALAILVVAGKLSIPITILLRLVGGDV